MKKAIFIFMAVAAIAVFCPAESFAGTSGDIAADCAFLLATPDDTSSISAASDNDLRIAPVLSGAGEKFSTYLLSSILPSFDKAANSAKLIIADGFSITGLSPSRYSVKRE